MSNLTIGYFILGYLGFTTVMSVYAIFLVFRLHPLRAELDSASKQIAGLAVEAEGYKSKIYLLEIEKTHLETLYGPIKGLEHRIAGVKEKAIAEINILKSTRISEEEKLNELFIENKNIKHEIEKLNINLKLLQEETNIALSGYKIPNFDLEDHAAYVVEIKRLRQQQKDMIRDKQAVRCSVEWTLGDSRSEGQKMINRIIRLTLRAFNNECDLLIKNVSWKNAERTRARILKLAEILNELNDSMKVTIMPDYVQKKIREVDLTEQEKLKREEEYQRLKEQREMEREEARAQREYMAEIKRQERLENEKMAALKAARDQLAIASEEHRQALEREISQMEDELAEAIRNKGRLLSMAEQTRIGHIYVISNEGSFGEGVLKIGMTRRLDPMDRVRELGDASVPFPFEVHALLFTEDAPAFEKRLHSRFEQYRINRVNNRKEFFRVSPQMVKDAIDEEIPGVPFDIIVQSKEYLQSRLQ